MTILSEELPFTNEALKIFIDEVEKEIERLSPYVSQFNKFKRRLKLARERLKTHGQEIGKPNTYDTIVQK